MAIRNAISGNQWQSVAISGNQERSVAIRNAISGNQWQSVAISGNQERPVAIRNEISGNQWQSVAIRNGQWLSGNARLHLRQLRVLALNRVLELLLLLELSTKDAELRLDLLLLRLGAGRL